MTDELKRRMARLREIAPHLNAATDQASRLVAQVEKFLVEELRIGVSAEVSYEELPAGTDDDNRVLRIRHSLAFGRGSGSFRIHVLRETIAGDDGTSAGTTLAQERMLWPSCPRETKLKAFEKLPALLDKIIEEAERLAQTSEATRAKVKEMVGEDEPVEAGQGRGWASDYLGWPWFTKDTSDEAAHGRARVSEGGTPWSRQLIDAAHRYRQCERDVVESETDGDAWEARMEAEGRDDADPHEDWEKARARLIRLVCIATGHDPAEPLDAPIAALTDDWLLVVSPGRDDPWDDEDADSRRLSVISRTEGLNIFS
jgi:hypothetical protein